MLVSFPSAPLGLVGSLVSRSVLCCFVLLGNVCAETVEADVPLDETSDEIVSTISVYRDLRYSIQEINEVMQEPGTKQGRRLTVDERQSLDRGLRNAIQDYDQQRDSAFER